MPREARILCVVTALAAMIGGCTSTTTLGVRPEFEAAAKQFEPLPGKARIYVFVWPAGDYAGWDPISVGSHEAPYVADSGFAIFDVEPGVHLVTVGEGKYSRSTQITAEADKTYFVNTHLGGGWVRSMGLMPNEAGMDIVRKCTMAWSTQLPASACKENIKRSRKKGARNSVEQETARRCPPSQTSLEKNEPVF